MAEVGFDDGAFGDYSAAVVVDVCRVADDACDFCFFSFFCGWVGDAGVFFF